MANSTGLTNKVATEKQLLEQKLLDLSDSSTKRNEINIPDVSVEIAGGKDIQDPDIIDSHILDSIKYLIEREKTIAATIREIDEIDTSKLLSKANYPRYDDFMYSSAPHRYVFLPKQHFPRTTNVNHIRRLMLKDYKSWMSMELAMLVYDQFSDKVFAGYSKKNKDLNSSEISTEGLTIEELAKIFQIDTEGEIEEFLNADQSLVVTRASCNTIRHGEEEIALRQVPYFGASFQNYLDQIHWQVVHQNLMTKYDRRRQLVEDVNDIRVTIQELTNHEAAELIKANLWNMNDLIFQNTVELAQLYAYHLNSSLVTEIKASGLKASAIIVSDHVIASSTTPNLVRAAINRLSVMNNRSVGIKLLLAAQMPNVRVDLLFPTEVTLDEDQVLQAFIIWFTIPEELLTERSNRIIAAIIAAGTTQYSYNELLNGRVWDYRLIKGLLSTPNVSIPRASSMMLESSTATYRRYSCTPIRSIIPYDRSGYPLRSSNNRFQLRSNGGRYMAEGLVIATEHLGGIFAAANFSPAEVSEAHATMEIFATAFPREWTLGELVYPPHAQTSMELLASYGITKARPYTSYQAKDIINLFNTIGVTFTTVISMVSTVDNETSFLRHGQELDAKMLAWENIEKVLKHKEHNFVHRVYLAYRSIFTEVNFYDLIRNAVRTSGYIVPIERSFNAFDDILSRYPFHFGIVNSVVLTSKPYVNKSYDRDFLSHPIVENNVRGRSIDRDEFNSKSARQQLEMIKLGSHQINWFFPTEFVYHESDESFTTTPNISIVDNKLFIPETLTFHFIVRRRGAVIDQSMAESIHLTMLFESGIKIRLTEFVYEVYDSPEKFRQSRFYVDTKKNPLATSNLMITKSVN